MDLVLSSAAFEHGGQIPALYNNTHSGRNVSPPLRWEYPPAQTKCFGLIAEDLDAPLIGTITHWVLYNIPPERRELPEGIPPQESLPDGTLQGRNFLNRHAYMGPRPPFGTHRYIFTIYALDAKVEPDPRMDRKRLLRVMAGHILRQAQLAGCYSKKKV